MAALDVLCVLKSGGAYNEDWVRKLRDGVKRNLSIEHGFTCLSDIPTPCDRISLKHDWPGWWSKIEIFEKGIIRRPTLYLDLDTVITGPLDDILKVDYPFAMLRNFHQPEYVGSGVMWFRDAESVPHHVYDKFARMPKAYIEHHERSKIGSHLGDQAFVWDAMKGNIPFINDKFSGIKSYKYHCRSILPPDARMVCFHGPPRPPEVKAPWIKEHWV